MRQWLRTQIDSLSRRQESSSSAHSVTPARAALVNSTTGSHLSKPVGSALSRSASSTSTRSRWHASLGAASTKLGEHLKLAEAQLQASAYKLRGVAPFAEDIAAIAIAAGELRAQLSQVPEGAVASAGDVAHQVLLLGHQALRPFAAGRRWNSQRQRNRVPDGLEALRSGVTLLIEAARDYLQSLVQAIDYTRNIDALGNGDLYRIELGEDSANSPWSGSVEVLRRADGRYLVVANGSALVERLFSEPACSRRGEINTVEFLLASPAEAKKATGMLLRYAVQLLETHSHETLTQASSGKATPEDWKFLASKMVAVEMHGLVAEELFTASLAEEGSNEVLGNSDPVARLELFTGASPELVLYRRISGRTAAHSTEEMGMAFGPSSLEGSLRIDSRVSLPAQIDVATMKRAPLASLTQIAPRLLKAREAQMTLSFCGQPTAGGRGTHLNAQVTLTGKPSDVLGSGAAARAVNGDLTGAFQKAGARSTVQAKVIPVVSNRMQMHPTVSALTLGVSVPIGTVREDALDRPARSFTGSAVSAARDLSRVFASLRMESAIAT